VLLAAGASLTLLTLGFHLLAIGFRRAAAKPWSSLPLEPVGLPVPPERIVPEAVPIS